MGQSRSARIQDDLFNSMLLWLWLSVPPRWRVCKDFRRQTGWEVTSGCEGGIWTHCKRLHVSQKAVASEVEFLEVNLTSEW
jgi:hypothetical protein